MSQSVIHQQKPEPCARDDAQVADGEKLDFRGHLLKLEKAVGCCRLLLVSPRDKWRKTEDFLKTGKIGFLSECVASPQRDLI